MGKRKNKSARLVGASRKATPTPGPLAATKRRPRELSSGSSSSSSTWTTPKKGRLKLNFDGSSKSKSSSIGGVYRDHKGRFVLGYAQRVGKKTTSSVAELLALKRGLQLAVEHGWRNISIEGDFKTAVDAIASRARVRAKKDRKQCGEIARLLPRLGRTTVSHVLRRGNKVADRFAKLGYKAAARRRRVWRGVPPHEVLQFLERDAAQGK